MLKGLKIFDFLKKKNVKRFAIFFTIAFVFLIFSKLTNDYKQTIVLKVNCINIEDEVILQQDSLNTIRAYVEAKGFVLFPFIFKEFKEIVIDAKTDVSLAPNSYIFDVQKYKYLVEDQLGDSYKVLLLKPDTLRLSYSKMATKLVPVVLKSNINFAPGFDIKDQITFNIDSIKIVGSETILDSITELTTESIELNEVNTNIKETLKIDNTYLTNVEIFPKTIDISAHVARFTEGTLEVPVTIINKPLNTEINYFPKQVTLSYYVDLESYNTISPSDFIIECDYSKATDNQRYLVPIIVDKPDNIKRVSIKQNRIDFIKL